MSRPSNASWGTIERDVSSGQPLGRKPSFFQKMTEQQVKHWWLVDDYREYPIQRLDWYGYGSIPINTIFRGMNIHKSQLFWCELQGYCWFWHTAISISIMGILTEHLNNKGLNDRGAGREHCAFFETSDAPYKRADPKRFWLPEIDNPRWTPTVMTIKISYNWL